MEELNVILTNYLSEHFDNVPLESLLFYYAPVGLRFELGESYRGVEDPSYFTNVITPKYDFYRCIRCR